MFGVMLAKWAALKTRTSVSGNWMMILVSGLTAYLAWNNIQVFTSSWLHVRSATLPWESLVIATHRFPSLNPPPMISLVFPRSLPLPRLYKDFDMKSHRFSLFLGLLMYLAHFLGTSVEGPPMCTSSTLDVHSLIAHRLWWTFQSSGRKRRERRIFLVEIFSPVENSCGTVWTYPEWMKVTPMNLIVNKYLTF